MPVIGLLNHVQITIPVGAESEARAYYCRLLGLVEIEKPESLKGRGGLWLQLGELQIHVGTEDGFDRRTTKAHLAYEVDDLEHWRSVIAGAGPHDRGERPHPWLRALRDSRSVRE